MDLNLHQYGRAAKYLTFVKQLSGKPQNVSAAYIARSLRLNDVLVRKDLAEMVGTGRPKIGYSRDEIIFSLEKLLGFDDVADAALCGVGNLGKSLLSYPNFAKYGVKIIVAFDVNESLTGTEYAGVKILQADKIADMCFRLRVSIGIIAVPAEFAQKTCEAMVEGGVRVLWNFAPINLNAPNNVTVKNEDLAASLAGLKKRSERNLKEENNG